MVDSLESGMPAGWLNAGGYFNTNSANSGNGKAGLNTTGDIIRTAKYPAVQELTFLLKYRVQEQIGKPLLRYLKIVSAGSQSIL